MFPKFKKMGTRLFFSVVIKNFGTGLNIKNQAKKMTDETKKKRKIRAKGDRPLILVGPEVITITNANRSTKNRIKGSGGGRYHAEDVD